MRIAALDVGGTKIRYALGNSDGEILTNPEELPTAEDIEEQITEILAQYFDQQFDAVSIVTPETVNKEDISSSRLQLQDGTIVEDIEYGESIKEEFGKDLEMYIENDVNSAALGEYLYGDGSENMAYVTFSTGIAAGIISNGKLVEGAHGNAGEIGYISLAPEHADLTERAEGAWEFLCSGKGIPDFVNHLLEDEEKETTLNNYDEVTSEILYKEAEKDEVAENYATEIIGELNSRGVAALALVTDPEKIVLGGSIASENPELLMETVEQKFDKFYPDDYIKPEISLTDQQEDTGLYGALALPEFQNKN